jgi:Cof subfamily protein (haloacid dehalogenase superfamily)
MLVLDIDGTLINKLGEISFADRTAISSAKKQGLIVTLCTGRSMAASSKVIDDLQLNGAHIFFDGTRSYDPIKDVEIESRPIDSDLVVEMTEYALTYGVPLDLFSKTRYFVFEENWRTEMRRDFFGINAVVTDFHTIYNQERIIKGGIVVKSPAEIKLAEGFASKFADRLNLTWTFTPAFPGVHFINVVGKGTSKGQALETLCKYLRIPLEQVCAIGDGANDISLLSVVGLGIAMKNSPDELISRAHFVTDDVDNNGVAKAIRKFIFQD